MPFRKSPELTSALLAANRLNAKKSTGPRTAEGKARVALNALKHGRYAKQFRASLTKAREDVDLFDWVLAQVCETFRPVEAVGRTCAELLARQVWCAARPALGAGTKPESPLKSILRPYSPRMRFRITDDQTGVRLVFYVKRRRGTVPPRIALAWLLRLKAGRRPPSKASYGF